MQMYNDKAQVCIGSCSAMLSWIAGMSFSHDVIPVVSYIGVCAGAFVALHGVYMIIKHWLVDLKKKNTRWY